MKLSTVLRPRAGVLVGCSSSPFRAFAQALLRPSGRPRTTLSKRALKVCANRLKGSSQRTTAGCSRISWRRTASSASLGGAWPAGHAPRWCVHGPSWPWVSSMPVRRTWPIPSRARAAGTAVAGACPPTLGRHRHQAGRPRHGHLTAQRQGQRLEQQGQAAAFALDIPRHLQSQCGSQQTLHRQAHRHAPVRIRGLPLHPLQAGCWRQAPLKTA